MDETKAQTDEMLTLMRRQASASETIRSLLILLVVLFAVVALIVLRGSFR